MTGQWREDPKDAIERRMAELEHALEKAVGEYERLGQAAAQAAKDEEMAYAKAFLGAEGSMDLRRQIALLETVEVRFDRRVADHKVAVQKQVLYQLHDVVDMTRSRGANVRKEIELAQSGVRT
jgi:hypothetical protein